MFGRSTHIFFLILTCFSLNIASATYSIAGLSSTYSTIFTDPEIYYLSAAEDTAEATNPIEEQVEQSSNFERISDQTPNAISNVTSESVNRGFINNAIGLIQGRVAGLSITRPGSDPNEAFDARLRGLSNIHGETRPTIIIDGVINAQIENIDPNDIASFEIVKNAAATAIYGLRGANGVIIINTKSGMQGRTKVSYNTYLNIENAIREQPMMSTEEWKSLSYKLNIDNDQYDYSTNWYDEILQTAVSNVHNLSISSGTDKSSFYVGVNYRKVNGILKTTGFDRFNTLITFRQKTLDDRLVVGLSLAGTMGQATYADDRAFRHAPSFNPTAPVRSSDPEYEQYGGYFQGIYFDNFNPVALVEQTDHNGANQRLNLQLNGTYALTKNLSVGLLYAFQSVNLTENKYEAKDSFGAYGSYSGNGWAYKGLDHGSNQFLQANLSWNEKVGLGIINVSAGYSYQYFDNEQFRADGGDFLTDAFQYNQLAAAQDFNNGFGEVDSYKATNKIIGFYGRADFEWENTYFVSLVANYDGSSRLGTKEKWTLFHGVSAGVDFASIAQIANLDLLKLRIGTGKAGQDIHFNHISLTQFAPGWGYMPINGNYVSNYEMTNEGDPDIKAPIKIEWNMGLDFSIREGLVYGSIDYYNNTIKDLLWEWWVPVPPNVVSRRWYNSGELHNSGLEFSLFSHLVSRSNFTYTPSLIISKYIDNSFGTFSDRERGLEFEERSIGHMGPGCSYGLLKMEEDGAVGAFWGPLYQGISSDGEWIFVGESMHNGIVEYDDFSTIGNGLPNFELGWGNNLRYGKWDLFLFFRGVFGHSIINMYGLQCGAPQMMNAYNVPSLISDMRHANGTYLVESPRYSSYYVEKGNYFKLDNFDLGYNFNFRGGAAVKSLRVYLMGNNLFVMSSYSGSDPEVRYALSDDQYGSITPGIDERETWLMTRSLSFGVRVGF